MYRLCQLLFALIVPLSVAIAEEQISIDDYFCSQFLADVAAPNDAKKVLRSMMIISWATGYAAAYQTSELRADIPAIRLMAIVVGEACRQTPNERVVFAVVREIDAFARRSR